MRNEDYEKMVHDVKDKTQDAFYMVAQDADGNYQRTFTTDAEGNRNYNSISFEYGTVESQRSISYSLDGITTDVYDVYKVRGDDKGTALFEFLGNNVTGSSFILSGQLFYGYTVRELNHTHPVNPTPSRADNRYKTQVSDFYRNRGMRIPNFNIYHVPTRSAIPY